MDSRAVGVVSNPIEVLPEPGALAMLRRWHEGWVRYHEARYRYLGEILDCAAIPCCEFPALRALRGAPIAGEGQ